MSSGETGNIENKHLVEAYKNVDYNSSSMQSFLGEVVTAIEKITLLSANTSLLDIGCGKGYFLKYLSERGLKNIRGLEPYDVLRDDNLFDNIIRGSYEENVIDDNSYDIVFTCHTLHHLPDSRPLFAIREMLRIARKYIVIVEINNTNIPMFFRSLLYLKGERNAYLYNLGRVRSMLKKVGANILLSDYLDSCYLTSDSLAYRTLARIGAPPYNISIADKQG